MAALCKLRAAAPRVQDFAAAGKVLGKRFLSSAHAGTTQSSYLERSFDEVCLFGKKHYGRPLSEVVAEDPKYCEWLLRAAQEVHASRAMQQSAEWLLVHAPHLKEQDRSWLAAGNKYYGRNLSELVSEDPTYCQWILCESKEADASPQIQEMAAWLTENAPHLQELEMLAGGKKHYGRPMSEVVAEDPTFCQWVLQKAEEGNASSQTRAMAGWLKENAAHLQEDKAVLATGRKYKGRPMSEVVADDPAYCQWILQQAEAETASDNLRYMAKWLTANAPHLKEHSCFASGGKHNGRPMSEVASEDPEYCRWILRASEEEPASQTLCEKARWLRTNVPELQEQPSALRKPSHEGRHGRHLSQLVAEDPSYCLWILRQAQEQPTSNTLQEKAEWLLKHAAHLKETQVVCMKSVHRGVPLPQLVAEDPRWCRFVVDQPEAKSKEFAEAAAWLRQNVPELLEVSKDDAVAIDHVGQRMFYRYGKWFVVRNGRHRMKTFAAMMEEAPNYVNWAVQTVQRATANQCATSTGKNFRLLAAFARQQQNQDSTEPPDHSGTSAKA